MPVVGSWNWATRSARRPFGATSGPIAVAGRCAYSVVARGNARPLRKRLAELAEELDRDDLGHLVSHAEYLRSRYGVKIEAPGDQIEVSPDTAPQVGGKVG